MIENVPEHLQNELLAREEELVEEVESWEDRDEDNEPVEIKKTPVKALFTPIQLWDKETWSEML